MRAITVLPGVANSARLDDVPEPPVSDGSVLVRTLALGVCGTDREIVSGLYGEAPSNSSRLVLGHESLGVVIEAPAGSGLVAGDHVVGIVRRPDPVPCPACAAGEWDMCRNELYTERGIKGLHGYGAERFRVEPEFAVRADPALGMLAVLTEPASIVAKAWDHIERVGGRAASWRPGHVLVTGSGPIGLLAALLGVQRGCEVTVFDRSEGGSKPQIIRDLGASHRTGDVGDLSGLRADVVLECTGAPQVIAAVLGSTAPGGVVCLAGIGGDRALSFDIGRFNRNAVLRNEAVFGAVNANLTHYRAAADALTSADRSWLARLITRRVPLERFGEALEHRADDIKVVVEFPA